MNKLIHLALVVCVATFVTACSPSQSQQKPLIISGIPDQKPEILQPLYDDLAKYLEQKLGIPVKYQASATYQDALDSFRLGKVDLVWFGGLTGVQATLLVKGSQAIAQRDIDEAIQSVFIANVATGLKPFGSVKDLQQIKGHSFTFSSQLSTSGYLMPLYFFDQAGVHGSDFRGPAFFSGSHNKTIDIVESGDYEVGVVNSQIWDSRVQSGKVDLKKVIVLWKTPSFSDNHWVIHPDAVARYGSDFIQRVQTALFNLDSSGTQGANILEVFVAKKFITTQNENYASIEAIARKIGLIQD